MSSRRLARLDPEFERVDPALLKAIVSPLRRDLLVRYADGVASPAELADDLGETVSLVAYHTRVLLNLGVIELVREERVRGATKHYYQAVVRPFLADHQWVSLPLELRRSIFRQDLEKISREVAAAAAGAGFDHPQTHVSRSPLDLDEEAFDAVVDVLNDTLHRVQEIAAEAAARRAAQPRRREAIAMELAILYFGRPD